MNCKQAELAMMEHMEKTIQPPRAKDLALHVLECENCREYYIGFDMALEVLDDEELSVAPVDFTQCVMAKVREMPVHSKPIPLSLRLLWGFGAIFLGIGLLFAFNPEWLTVVTAQSPILYTILSAMYAARQVVSDSLTNLVATYQGTEIALLNAAIVFVAVVGILLMVLQRSEKSTKA